MYLGECAGQMTLLIILSTKTSNKVCIVIMYVQCVQSLCLAENSHTCFLLLLISEIISQGSPYISFVFNHFVTKTRFNNPSCTYSTPDTNFH
jgi:hypothetical protein